MLASKTLSRFLNRVFLGTMLSRITGMVRDMVMGAAFGSAPIAAAFLIAFRFANLPRRLFGEGAMHAAFVPQYEAIRKQDPVAADRFFRDVTYALASLTGFLSVASVAILFLFFYRSSPVVRLTCLMLPILPFICLYGLKLAYHNCHGSYFRPSSASCLFNLAWISGGLVLWGHLSEQAMVLLAVAVGLGFVLQWAVVAFPIRNQFSLKGVRLWSPEIAKCSRSLGLGILGVGAAQINSALDPLFATVADPSAPVFLWLAIRLQQLPLALFGIALSSVILPTLSRTTDPNEYRKALSWGRSKVLELMAPCTIGIFTCGLPAVALLFYRGQFTSGDCAETTFCLWAYGIGLVPMALTLLRTTAFHSRADYRTPALAAALAVALNLMLNTLFVFVVHWPGASIALATSLSALFQSSFLRIRLKDQGKGALYPWFVSLIAGIASISIDRLFYGDFLWSRPVPAGLFNQLLTLGVSGAAFLAAYGLFFVFKRSPSSVPR